MWKSVRFKGLERAGMLRLTVGGGLRQPASVDTQADLMQASQSQPELVPRNLGLDSRKSENSEARMQKKSLNTETVSKTLAMQLVFVRILFTNIHQSVELLLKPIHKPQL